MTPPRVDSSEMPAPTRPSPSCTLSSLNNHPGQSFASGHCPVRATSARTEPGSRGSSGHAAIHLGYSGCMCLSVPARVVEVHDSHWATVEMGGTNKKVSIDLIDNVSVDDYVLLHVGFAIEKL